MRRFSAVLTMLAISAMRLAEPCATCRPQVEAEVYTQAFGATLGQLLLPLGILAVLSLAIGRVDQPVFRKEEHEA